MYKAYNTFPFFGLHTVQVTYVFLTKSGRLKKKTIVIKARGIEREEKIGCWAIPLTLWISYIVVQTSALMYFLDFCVNVYNNNFYISVHKIITDYVTEPF